MPDLEFNEAEFMRLGFVRNPAEIVWDAVEQCGCLKGNFAYAAGILDFNDPVATWSLMGSGFGNRHLRLCRLLDRYETRLIEETEAGMLFADRLKADFVAELRQTPGVRFV